MVLDSAAAGMDVYGKDLFGFPAPLEPIRFWWLTSLKTHGSGEHRPRCRAAYPAGRYILSGFLPLVQKLPELIRPAAKGLVVPALGAADDVQQAHRPSCHQPLDRPHVTRWRAHEALASSAPAGSRASSWRQVEQVIGPPYTGGRGRRSPAASTALEQTAAPPPGRRGPRTRAGAWAP